MLAVADMLPLVIGALRPARPRCALRAAANFGRRSRDLLTHLAVCSMLTLGPAPRLPLPPAIAALSPTSLLRQQEAAIEKLFEMNTPSVVYISTFSQRSPLDLNAMVEVPQGTGSGFAWDRNGHIVTNYHVIRAAQEAKVTVTSTNGQRTVYSARIVGANPDKDVAVLELLLPKGSGDSGRVRTVPIRLGTSNMLKVGQTVLAIGNPYGLDHTLTMGVVSGLGREMLSPSGRPISNVIQTDAAINPGNSGGVLLDVEGKLVGMNTGIGFAIPVDTLAQQVEAIITKGRATRAILGISVLEGVQTRVLGINEGVLVLKVPAGSEAAKAGLRGSSRDQNGSAVIGDVIIECDGRKVNSEADLFKALDTHSPGDVVKVVVLRGTPASALPLEKGGTSGEGGVVPEELERVNLSIKLTALDLSVSQQFGSAQGVDK